MSDMVVNNGLWIAIGFSLLGLAAAAALYLIVRSVPAGNEKMREVADAIEAGAKAYLKRQIMTISIIAAIIAAAILIWYPTDKGQVASGFLLGAICSLAAGYVGMRVAVITNVRTAQAATVSQHTAMRTAFDGGAVTGLLVVGLGLLAITVFYMVTKNVQSLIGLALGSSLISVFARLGGGIYTKAADVGADLVGKLDLGLDEDDPRNPAVIADNVGDNVGDCAGMAADVFETYVVSLIGAILIGTLTTGDKFPEFASRFVTYPLMLGALSILSAIIGIASINVLKGSPMFVLATGVGVSAVLSAAMFWPMTHWVFANVPQVDPTKIYYAALVGLGMTALVVVITDYFTSEHRPPVQRIAAASETGHATNIISGLAVGHHSTVPAVAAIGVAILLSFNLGGLYGVAVAVVSMLSMSGIIISLDAFGPITDNAGGIAVMSGLSPEVRKITDGLDAVGNTLKAVTKGYAIASAGLAALVLFGSYVEELHRHTGIVDGAVGAIEFSLRDPKVIIGLFIGGLLPFWFTAASMDAVGKAAGAVVKEVHRQLKEKPGILKGTEKPDYGRCVDIVTKAALIEMIWPALMPVVFVVTVAYFNNLLGPVVLGGLLVGTIVTGLFVALAMTGSGGAWDNAKKYIEAGHHGGKGSKAHQAAVTGDTVGDPYKDTAGPAINPMIKVVNIVAILAIPVFF